MPTLESLLDRIVSTPALVRKLKPRGTLKVKDANGQLIEVPYEKTAAGYVNFSAVDESIQVQIARAPRAQMIQDTECNS